MGTVAVEVSGHLVVPPVFNTGEAEYLGLAGSIPVHLRHVFAGESLRERKSLWRSQIHGGRSHAPTC